MEWLIYALLAIETLGIFYLVFSFGRLFEMCIQIREIDKEIEKNNKELEKLNKELEELIKEKAELEKSEGEEECA